MVLLMVDFLIGLVSLPAQDNGISALGVIHGVMDRFYPVRHRNMRRLAALQARQNIRDDRIRILRAGIIRCHDHKIRMLGGNFSHLGPLGLIPVPAAAKYRHRPALGKLLHGRKHILQSVRAVGIIDQNRIILSGGRNNLHPALHMGDRSQDLRAAAQGNPQLLRRAQHIQRIIYHKFARNANPDFHTLIRCHGIKGHMIRTQADRFRPQIGRLVFRVKIRFAGCIPQKPRRPGIVRVADTLAAVPEQDRLCVTVCFHRLMEVQMVLGQVGKNTDLIVHAVYPVQVKRMRGSLHHHVRTAGVAHLTKQALQLKRLRRRAFRRQNLLPDHILIGPDQAHLGPQRLLQNGLEQVCGRGFPVGAGHGRHHHLIRRMPEEVGTQHRQGAAGILHPHPGDLHGRFFFAQHTGRTAFRRFPDIGMPIGRKAPHRDEEVAGPDSAGIVLHLRDLHLRVGMKLLNGNAI